MSSHTGLYVKCLGTGEIQSVQVVDTDGIEYSLDADQYTKRGIKPPIGQLKARTSKPIFRWFTIASIFIALVIAAFSVLHDCSGVANHSEQCVWSKALYLVTAGVYFIITWPILLVIGYSVWGHTKD